MEWANECLANCLNILFRNQDGLAFADYSFMGMELPESNFIGCNFKDTF